MWASSPETSERFRSSVIVSTARMTSEAPASAA